MRRLRTSVLAGLTVTALGCASSAPETEEHIATVVASIVYGDPGSLPEGEARLVITDEVGDATILAQERVPFQAGSPPTSLVVRSLDPETIPPTIDVELIMKDRSGGLIGTALAKDVAISGNIVAVTLFAGIARRGDAGVIAHGELNGSPILQVDSVSPGRVDCSRLGPVELGFTVDDPEDDPISTEIIALSLRSDLDGMPGNGSYAALGPMASNTPRTLTMDFGDLSDADVTFEVSAVQVPPGIEPQQGSAFGHVSVTIPCRGREMVTPVLDTSGGGQRRIVQTTATLPATPHVLTVAASDDGAGFSVECEASFKEPAGPASTATEILDVERGDFVAVEPSGDGIGYEVFYIDPAQRKHGRVNASAQVICQARCTRDGVCAGPEVCGVCEDCGNCDADRDGADDLVIDWSFEEPRGANTTYDHAPGVSRHGMLVGEGNAEAQGFRGASWELRPIPTEPAYVYTQGVPVSAPKVLTVGALVSPVSSSFSVETIKSPGTLAVRVGAEMKATFTTDAGLCVDRNLLAEPAGGAWDMAWTESGVWNWVVTTFDSQAGTAELWVNGVSDGPTTCPRGSALNSLTTFGVGAFDPPVAHIVFVDELKVSGVALPFDA